MLKFFALLFTLIMILPCASVAEQDDFQLEGEWYCISAYTNLDCHKAELREDGSYYIRWNDESEVIFYEDGQVDYIYTEEWTDMRSDETRKEVTTETDHVEYCRLSDDACLYYVIMDNELYGYYFIKRDNDWTVYNFNHKKCFLFLNGRAIPYTDGDPFEYYTSGNQMFLIHEDQYVRGEIQPIGEHAFVFDIDSSPWIDTNGEIEVNYGTMFFLFINTSVL